MVANKKEASFMENKKEGYEYNGFEEEQQVEPIAPLSILEETSSASSVNFIVMDEEPQSAQTETVSPVNTSSSDETLKHNTMQTNPAKNIEDIRKENTEQLHQHAFEDTKQHTTSNAIPPKPSFSKRYKTPLLVCSCLLIGGIGGFSGTYIANRMSGGGSDKVVLQTVDRVDSSGNTVTNMSVKEVVANTANSVVEITTESATTDTFLQQYVTEGAGSGVIISQDGYIVTNNHVVEDASKITVRTKSGEEYSATLVGRDAKTDLAVIKVDASGLNAAVMGNSADLGVGETAIAIGNPLGELGGTVTEGIISALDREITIDGQSMTLLQTDTAINSGNSGGGLFNSAGELIGIVNAKSSGSTVEGLGFAIPIDTAKPVIESLIANGYVSGRPQLGVSIVNITSETSAFQSGVNDLGVYIAKVTTDSAADKAGLKVRDRVISVDGQEITSSEEITKIVDSKKVGDTIKLVISRDGKEQTITATLQEALDETLKEDSNTSNQLTPQGGSSRGFQQ